MSLKRKLTSSMISLSLLGGCSSLKGRRVEKTVSIQKLSRSESLSNHDVVTVWVHGTGRNPLIRKFHTSPEGLLSWNRLPHDYGLKYLGKALHDHDAAEFHIEDFYTFGWSGRLNFHARQLAGKDLKNSLQLLNSNYKRRYGKSPRIRLVTHSHGCNVALNMAEQLKQQSEIQIDELVLLACPVQKATSQMIESPVLKKIFALYSNIDLTQVLDPQGLYKEGKALGSNLFSERRFPPRENLIQAQIQWKGFGLTHVGFVRERFGKALPNILAALRAGDDDNSATAHTTHYVVDIKS